MEYEKYKMLWDFTIPADGEIEQWKQDIVVIDKEKRAAEIIDIAVRGDQNVKMNELEEITKYQDSKLQMQKLWNVKATVITAAVNTSGTLTEKLENHLKTVGIPIVISYLLTECSIARRVFGISEGE